KENPYRLATDIWGVGFLTADQLALRMGLDPKSPLRAQAALRYILKEFSEKGHVGYPEEGVVAAAVGATQIGREIIEKAVEEVRLRQEIVRDSPALVVRVGDEDEGEMGGACVDQSQSNDDITPSSESWLFLKPLFLAELGVARQVHALC